MRDIGFTNGGLSDFIITFSCLSKEIVFTIPPTEFEKLADVVEKLLNKSGCYYIRKES